MVKILNFGKILQILQNDLKLRSNFQSISAFQKLLTRLNMCYSLERMNLPSQHRCTGVMLLSGKDSGGTVAGAVVVGGVLLAGFSAVHHYRLCWPD